jgi:ubiquinone/menaquinone biosynthesis C-methylase UbiE
MTFAIASAAYDRFMGRYSTQLAPVFADFMKIEPGMRVLDVGCGPGALAAELARRVGAARVAGVEPSLGFVEAARALLPDADIRHGAAEQLPWGDGEFAAALSQLVLSFVTDAEQVARELKRVVRKDGVVGACMWQAGQLQMSELFWEAAATLDPTVRQREASMRYRNPGEIAQLWQRAGLRDVEETVLAVSVTYRGFDDFWDPLITSAGPIGAFMATIDDAQRSVIREACRARLGHPQHGFDLAASACAVRGRV